MSRDKIDTVISPRFVKSITIVVMAWYVVLCVVHFLSQRPLWLDEFNVFRSVRDLLPREFFTQRLEAGQIFPKLYLFFVQRISEPFHFHLLSLRFLPFVAMLSAFFIWMRTVRREFKDPVAYLTYTLSWAGSALLVYYAGELKQYSMDVLVSGIFVAFFYKAEDLRRQDPGMYLAALGTLPFLGLVSYPAFLFFVFPLYSLVIERRKDGFWKKCFGVYLVSIALALAGFYFFDIRHTRADISSQGFGGNTISFVSVGEFFESFWDGVTNLFCRFFAERPRVVKRIAMPFGIIGFGYMFYAFFKNFGKDSFRFVSIRTIAFVIFIELFILGALQKYPFTVPRTVLFFAPLVFFLIIEAIREFKKVHYNLYVVLQAAYVIFLIVISFGIAREAFSGNLGAAPLIW